jgi:hypothetical protein
MLDAGGFFARDGCPCGYFTDPTRQCRCNPYQIQRYVSKISGPLLDRIDIHVEVPHVAYRELKGGGTGATSADIRAEVAGAVGKVVVDGGQKTPATHFRKVATEGDLYGDFMDRFEVAYRRGVRPEGNREAIRLMEKVFEPAPADWRGIGEVPGSGLKIRSKYKRFDAALAFDIDPGETYEPTGCICGEVLRGVKTPLDCRLFGKVCNPENPVGPCMVSSEGACSAYYMYGAAV